MEQVAVLQRELARAHLVANALHGQWADRLNLSELRALLKSAAAIPLDSLPVHLIDRGVLEPLAAGASRMTPGSQGRSFLAVVDVGAGTTDFGMFRLQTGSDGKWRAYPIKGTTDNLRRAGNALDTILVMMVSDRLGGGGGAIGETRRRILQNRARKWKEQLFETGVLADTVVDHPIRITLEEFLNHAGCVQFATQIQEKFLAMLGKVSAEGYNLHAPMGVGLLATGGGATLPMVKSLLELRVPQGSGTLVIAEVRGMPEYLLEGIDERRRAELNQAYPQLAVAIGGSSPFYADPRQAIDGNVAPRAAVGLQVEYKNDSHR